MDIKYLYENTELTLQQIADQLKIPFDRVWKYVKRNYTQEHRKTRKTICYRNSKLGVKNPMSGLTKELCPKYKGDVSDSKGYFIRLKPDWYTGRKNSRHVFSHHIVVCEYLKLTEIPKGWCVHHVDGNRVNNEFSNLVLMLNGDHQRLHHYLAGATTISKESTLKWVETCGTPFVRDDIVSSVQECTAAKADVA